MDIFTVDGFLRALMVSGIFGLIVVLGEYLRRSDRLKGEEARKFVHITTGTWAALWPIFLDLQSIAIIALGMSLFALFLRQRKVFQSVYSIRRISMGEVLIGFGLAASALIAKSGAVYASAVLIIAWADSLAALIGTRYGKKNSFKVLGSTKSVAGSLAFFATSFVIVCAFLYYESQGAFFQEPFALIYGLTLAVIIAFSMTIVELFGVYGLDNLTIPLFATIILNVLSK